VLAEGHYKLFFGTFGGHEKVKVFWVDGCGTPIGKLHKVTVSPSSATITVGASQTFTATGFDKLGNEISITPTWSTNSTIASCKSGGTGTSDAAGRFIVSATSVEIVGTATLHVTAAVLARITVTPPFAAIALGSSQTFTATGFDTLNNEVSITPTWSASTSAGCGSSGTCTPTATGTCTAS